MNAPKPGSTWLHKNGKVYRVLFLTNTANERPDHPVDVVYQGVANSYQWSRPLSDWHRSFTEVLFDQPPLPLRTGERIVIPQIETLRKLRDELYPYLLTKEEFDALTDVINHFDACADCILQTENDHAGHQPPLDRTEHGDGRRSL